MALSADRSSSRQDKGELGGSDEKLCPIAVHIASLLNIRPALFKSAMLEVGDLQRFGACGQRRKKQGDELWNSCAGNNSPVAQVLTTILALV